MKIYPKSAIHMSALYLFDCIKNLWVMMKTFSLSWHYVKCVYIRSFSGSYFPAFDLNTEIYSVNLSTQSKCGKIRTRKTPKTDTFYAVWMKQFHKYSWYRWFDKNICRKTYSVISTTNCPIFVWNWFLKFSKTRWPFFGGSNCRWDSNVHILT